MRGRKPKPLHLRLLDGNAGHRPLNVEPTPPADADQLAPPADLHPRQQAIWREAIANASPGALRVLDLPVFAAYVAAIHTFEEARARVAAKGSVVKTKDGNYMQNPWLSVQNKQALLIKAYAAELGFSPTARMRVKADPSPTHANPFDDLKSLDDE